jgi:hypothetical protein
VVCAATTHSVATVFYVSRKIIGTAAARGVVKNCLNVFEILGIDRQCMLDADAQPGTDFEDNILIAVASPSSLDAIVTRNPADFAHSPIPVWELAELLKRLPGAGPAVGGAVTPP